MYLSAERRYVVMDPLEQWGLEWLSESASELLALGIGAVHLRVRDGTLLKRVRAVALSVDPRPAIVVVCDGGLARQWQRQWRGLVVPGVRALARVEPREATFGSGRVANCCCLFARTTWTTWILLFGPGRALYWRWVSRSLIRW